MKAARLFLALALVLMIGSTAFATDAADWLEKAVTDTQSSWEWSVSDWYQNANGICQLDLLLGWYKSPGADRDYSMAGNMPIDPIVNQMVTNYSNERWSDWHVQLINGTIVDGSVAVIKDGDVTPWDITYQADPGYDSGFTAIGWPPAENVGNMERLSIYFVFNPIDPNQRVTIRQWPTTDYIPEPSSIAALGMGLVSVGFALRRRRR